MYNNRNKYKNSKQNQNNEVEPQSTMLRRNNSQYMNQISNAQEEPENDNIDNLSTENMNEEPENVNDSNETGQLSNLGLGKGLGLPGLKSGMSTAKSLVKGLKNNPGLNVFFKKYKLIILLCVGILLVFMLLLIVTLDLFAFESSASSSNKSGLAGYDYYEVEDLCETVTVYNHEKTEYTRELDFETEYIPGVVDAEVRGFSDSPEVLKTFAIAARSYALKNMNDDCSIEGSTYKQDFTFNEDRLKQITADDHPIKQAVMDTYGLVAIKNGELLTTYYDAACYRGEDENYYFIGYGRVTLGSEQIQKIPKSWEITGMLSYINKSKENGVECYQGHGMGISQYGAYYLATKENYSMLDILKYYNGDIELSSIYQAASSNFTSETSDGLNDILAMSLSDYLSSQGTSTEAYNEYILENVVSTGIGTKDAVAQAGASLVGGLYQIYGVRLPYTLSGQHYGGIYNASGANINRSATSFYGVDPEWGSKIYNSSGGNFYYGGSKYTRYGPDCSGFVSWAIHNAGFKVNVMLANDFGNLGTQKSLNGSQVAEPGDLLWNSGHIMLIIGVDTDKKVYYIAHASSGENGVKINTISFSDSTKKAVIMDDWYANNKRNVTEEEFIETYRNGYVGGYTGNYNKIVAVN